MTETYENDSKTVSKNTSNQQYPVMSFKSATEKHEIVMELDVSQKQALVNTMNIDYRSPVELAVLLKKITTELNKVYISHVIQQVTKDDWQNHLRTHGYFKYVNYNDNHNYVNVICTLEDFPKAVMSALGFDANKS